MKITSTYCNYSNTSKNNNKQNASFKGNPDNAITQVFLDLGEQFVTPVIGKYKPQRFISKLASGPRFYLNLSVASSIVLSAFYMFNTSKNKDIKEDQKLPLMINQGLVAVSSALITIAFNEMITKAISKYKDVFDKELKTGLDPKTLKETFIKQGKNAEELLKKEYNNIENIGKISGGLKTLQSIVIFGLIYRFISPVFITPLANKISTSIQNKSKEKQSTENQKSIDIKKA